jgi:hypothetical protein
LPGAILNVVYAASEAECRVCHDTTSDRHHVLVITTGYECIDCHEVTSQTGYFETVTIRDCIICHGTDVHTDSDNDGIFDD